MIRTNQIKQTEGISWGRGQVVALVLAVALITAGVCLGVIAIVTALVTV